MMYFEETEKSILKFIWNLKRQRIAKIIFKKEQRWSTQTHCFQSLYKAILVKTVWYCHKDKHIDQWGRIENLEINPYMYAQIIFFKGPRPFNRKRRVFNK